MIITIDGLAGSGKSTAAKLLARRNGFTYISSGHIYRAITWFCLTRGYNVDNLSNAEYSEIESLSLVWDREGNLLIDGFDITHKLRTKEVTESVIMFANHSRIRNFASTLLRAAAKKDDLIVDGRDMGTIVFPDADLKFYFVADIKDRMLNVARTSLPNEELNSLTRRLAQRDENDINREIAPLRQPEDSILIQTFIRPQEETINLMQKLVDIAKVFSSNIRIKSDSNNSPVSELSGNYLEAVLADKPNFSNLHLFATANIALFRKKCVTESHELLLFRDLRIPYIHDVDSNLDKFIGEVVSVRMTPRNLFFSGVQIPMGNLEYPWLDPSVSAILNSSYEGIKRLHSNTIEYLAMRGEFIFLWAISEHPKLVLKEPDKLQTLKQYMISTLRKCLKQFPKVIYRFTDFSYENLSFLKGFSDHEDQGLNYALGNRGTLRLLNDHRIVFNFEIETVCDLYSESNNLLVLLPFVRTIDEAIQATDLIRKRFHGRIGCMLETPFMLSAARQLENLFDFFVVGSSDLLQLMQGADRNLIAFEHETIEFTIRLVESFVKKIQSKKLIFVTHEKFYSALRNYPNVRLLNK